MLSSRQSMAEEADGAAAAAAAAAEAPGARLRVQVLRARHLASFKPGGEEDEEPKTGKKGKKKGEEEAPDKVLYSSLPPNTCARVTPLGAAQPAQACEGQHTNATP